MATLTPEKLDYLTIRLFAPGMSLLHRAGLGGLACTLKAMEREHEGGRLPKAKLPAPFVDGVPPWEIDEQSVTLRFGKPENAGEYLKKLFAFAFQIRDGLIYLPGQYGNVSPSLAVVAAIQDGIQNTFLQHGPTCGSRAGERTVTVEIDETPISITYDVFTSYKHQGWFWLDRDEKAKEKDPKTGKKLKTGRRVQNHQPFPAVADDGTLAAEFHEIDNKLSPGGIVRHDSFDKSAIRENAAGLICLHFSLIGCLTLSVNRVTAALLVPEITDLLDFAESRFLMTPQTARECRVAGTADAALQAQVRVRSRQAAMEVGVPTCYAMTCRPTQWNKKQKPRVATVQVPAAADHILDRFERALTWLPPRLVIPQKPTSGSRKKVVAPFWADSVIRPLVAENLAAGKKWYSGFVQLAKTAVRALRQPSERRGLHAMVADEQMWDATGEVAVVRAVHEALRGRYRDIADIYRDKPTLMLKKFDDEREKWGRAFAGVMTCEQFRQSLADFLRRGGSNPVLQEHWESVLPMLRPGNWRLARDLTLIGLYSYQSRNQPTGPEHQTNPE